MKLAFRIRSALACVTILAGICIICGQYVRYYSREEAIAHQLLCERDVRVVRQYAGPLLLQPIFDGSEMFMSTTEVEIGRETNCRRVISLVRHLEYVVEVRFTEATASAATIRGLIDMRALSSIEFRGMSINGELVDVLHGCRGLTDLRLQSCTLCQTGFESLLRTSTVSSLSLFDCELPLEVHSLGMISSLTSIDLRESYSSEEEVVLLQFMRPDLDISY